jgi:hypothetical protein
MVSRVQVRDIVKVWGQDIEILVTQKSKSVWVATGIYSGETFSCEDRSPGSAAKRWQEAARYRGNG